MLDTRGPLPPEERWRSKLAGTWVEEGGTLLVWYGAGVLPDGAPCVLRADVTIDWSQDQYAPYRLQQWAIYAGEDVLAWGKGERVYAQRSDCLKEVEALAIERGVRFGPVAPPRATAG